MEEVRNYEKIVYRISKTFLRMAGGYQYFIISAYTKRGA